MPNTVQPAPRRTVYAGYEGKENPSDRDRIAHLLQVYQSTETFNAEYLPKWAKASTDERIRGGLRIVQAREAAHGRLMRQRLQELGEKSFLQVPEERRLRDIPFFASPERGDLEKLRLLTTVLADPDEFFQPITDLMAEIESDPQTTEMLRTILDDEYATTHWFQRMFALIGEEEERRR